jgi:DNA polymerase III delta subunit
MNMENNNSKKESFKLDKLLPCYLYISKSEPILEERIQSVKSHLRGKVNFDTDFKAFDGVEGIDEEEFTNYINTPSLFSSKKIVVIKHMDKVSSSLQKRVSDLVTEAPGNSGNIVFFITALTQKLNTSLLD